MMNDVKVRVLVADDHPVVRKGLVHMLNADARLEVVGEAANGREAVEQYKRSRPDAAIVDLYMPEMDGIQTIEAIRSFDPKAKVVIITVANIGNDIYRGLRAGAQSCILKDATEEEIIKSILLTMDGQRYMAQGIGAKLADFLDFNQLSPRELIILNLMAEGISNKSIGRVAGITEGTVKFHVNNILTKLQCSSRTEAVALGIRHGFIRRA